MTSWATENLCNGMVCSQVVAPAEPLLTLEQAYAQLRLDPVFGTSPPSRPDDDLIRDAVQAATEELDGPTGWLGRALMPQTYKVTFTRFPSGRIRLPYPPLQSVVGVTYLDGDGQEQTLTPTADYVTGLGEQGVTYVEPAYQKRWPTGRAQGGAVGVTYVAGYADAAAVPACVRQYVKARLGFFYENREAEVVGSGLMLANLPAFGNALNTLRVRGVQWQ